MILRRAGEDTLSSTYLRRHRSNSSNQSKLETKVVAQAIAQVKKKTGKITVGTGVCICVGTKVLVNAQIDHQPTYPFVNALTIVTDINYLFMMFRWDNVLMHTERELGRFLEASWTTGRHGKLVPHVRWVKYKAI